VIIYEIYHYYYSSSGIEEPPPSYTAAELRLSDNILRRDLSSIQEDSFLSMNIISGSEETSLNYTAAELSGESSLTRRVELPDNRYSRKYAFRRASPISEELLLPVNYLKKPTLQKKK
jgi:hypothetical protein